MKNILTIIALCCVVTACNFSKGTKKDLATGLAVTYNGFAIDEAVLVNAQNERAMTNEVNLDETVAIVVQGIEHYEVQDGRVFPILDLTVTDQTGAVVLEGKDILGPEVQDGKGLAPENASTLRGTITVGNPMKSKENYHAVMRITDKLKPENFINVEVDLVVK
jgi:hypothetical protein